jgi:hypothetical protein
MKTIKMPRVFVSGTSYAVQERSGYLKADLNGYFGWTAVWADTYAGLVRRIKQVRSGGQ